MGKATRLDPPAFLQLGGLIDLSVENRTDGMDDFVFRLILPDQTPGADGKGGRSADHFVVAGENQYWNGRERRRQMSGGDQTIGTIHGDVHDDQIGHMRLQKGAGRFRGRASTYNG